jgi:hypothetical protein
MPDTTNGIDVNQIMSFIGETDADPDYAKMQFRAKIIGLMVRLTAAALKIILGRVKKLSRGRNRSFFPPMSHQFWQMATARLIQSNTYCMPWQGA